MGTKTRSARQKPFFYWFSFYVNIKQMSWSLVIDLILVSLVAVLVVFFAYALWQLSKTLRSLNELLKDVGKTVPPLLEKVDKTLNVVNSEVERVEQIVHTIEEVSEKVTAFSHLAQEIISSPLIKLVSFSAGARKAIQTLLKREAG